MRLVIVSVPSRSVGMDALDRLRTRRGTRSGADLDYEVVPPEGQELIRTAIEQGLGTG